MIADNRKSERHLSSFHVELLRLGEASPEERAWIQRHLKECRRCSELTVAFELHRVEFAERHAAAGPSLPTIARATPRRRRIARVAFGIALPVAAAVALIVTAQRPRDSGAVADVGDVSVKGGAGFTMVARRDARVFPVEPGAKLRANDQIRFVISHLRHRFVLIASVDGAGRANIYFPYEGTASQNVGIQERLELPGSIVVDASPGPERFFALLSQQPLQTTSVRRALDAVGKQGTGSIRNVSKLDVGADEQVSILVEKDAP